MLRVDSVVVGLTSSMRERGGVKEAVYAGTQIHEWVHPGVEVCQKIFSDFCFLTEKKMRSDQL